MSRKLTTEEEDKLLNLLCDEIRRDGGASYVTFLKEYNNVTLNKLLEGVKLLSFLEKYPKIFNVDRREKPHFVRLVSQSSKVSNNEGDCLEDVEMVDNKPYVDLCDKIVYALRKRHSRLDRKHQHDQTAYSLSVNTYWLLKRCVNEYHRYLRSNNEYRHAYGNQETPQVWPVGSKEWYDTFLTRFVSFLQTQKHTVKVQHDKVWLIEKDLENGNDNGASVMDLSNDFLKELDALLTQLVNEDGATQISLSLLLCRDHKGSFKRLLGGRDFWNIYQTYHSRGYFQNLKVWMEYSDIYLQSMIQQTQSGRMEVDQVGLFSVASTKWGRAIANIMVQYCRQVYDTNHTVLSSHDEKSSTHPSPKLAIDLTASVGGLVLGLLKTRYFSKVIGMEIDSNRAKLCQQNMERHGFSEQVEIQNVDSTKKLSQLSLQIQNLSCILIDPPWGGIHYKRDKNPTLYLGDLTLEKVMSEIARGAAKTKNSVLVGLRLPVTFKVNNFLVIMKDEYNISFQCLTVRKIGPQILLVVHIGHTNDTSLQNESNE